MEKPKLYGPKPLFSWIGCKRSLIHKFIHAIPKEIDVFYEPFLGSGATMLEVLSRPDIKIKKYVASDLNKALIQCFIDIRDRPLDLYNELDRISEVSPTNFRKLRDEYNEYLRHEKYDCHSSAIFIFMIKTCFRCLYRIGRDNKFVSPFAPRPNTTFMVKSHLMQVSKIIQNVEFIGCSYKDLHVEKGPRVFVYCDPPYYQLNVRSFTKYTNEMFDHQAFLEWIRQLSCFFILHNSYHPLLIEQFKEKYTLVRILAKRLINSTNPEEYCHELMILSRSLLDNISKNTPLYLSQDAHEFLIL